MKIHEKYNIGGIAVIFGEKWSRFSGGFQAGSRKKVSNFDAFSWFYSKKGVKFS